MKLKDTYFLEESYDKPRQCIIKQRHYFDDKGLSSQSCGFPSSHVWMWELDYKESWALKNWCFWTVVLKKILGIPLDTGWYGWITSPTRWTWVWASSRSLRWTGQLACCSSWGHKLLDITERLNWTELNTPTQKNQLEKKRNWFTIITSFSEISSSLEIEFSHLNNWASCYQVTRLCPTFGDTMNCSTPVFLHYIQELAKTHVHWVQQSIPLLFLSLEWYYLHIWGCWYFS